MDTIMEMMRHVVVFLLIASLIGNLLAGSEYRKYLSYATGLIVMVMVLVPVLNLLGKNGDWRDYLVQSDYQKKAEDTEREIAILGDEYENKLREQYENALRAEIAGLCGGEPEQCRLKMRDGKIERIHIKVETMPQSVTSLIDSLSVRYGVERKNIFIMEE